MALIEGIGDEVIQFLIIIVLLIVGIIAWRSTNLSDRQIIRTVLILERRSRHQVLAELPASSNSASDTPENAIDTGQEASLPDENVEEGTTGDNTRPKVNDNANTASTSHDLESNESQESSNSGERDSNMEVLEALSPVTSEVSNQSIEEPLSSVLRQRRLAFFQSRQETLLENQVSNSNNSEKVVQVSGVSYVSDSQRDGEDIVVASTSEETSEDSQPPPGNIRIRLKYLNDDQKLVDGRLEELLGDFKRRHFAIELAADKLVRLIFNGQVLQHDSETLQSLGLFDNCVVHCLVHQQRARSNSNNAHTSRRGSSSTTSNSNAANEAGGQRDWDLGNLLFASLSVLLGVAWYCRFQYAVLFNTTTTVALAGLTGVLGVTLVGLYLPDPDYVRH